MKYWKKSNGDCGTMDDTGYVPGSVQVPKSEYDTFVARIPDPLPINKIIELEDVETGERRRFVMLVIK